MSYFAVLSKLRIRKLEFTTNRNYLLVHSVTQSYWTHNNILACREELQVVFTGPNHLADAINRYLEVFPDGR